MRTTAIRTALALLLLGTAMPAAAGDLSLTIRDGRVTLIAKDVTVRQILAEWARVGQTKVVNGDKIQGGNITIELRDVPEAQALDTLLRSVSGYMVARRPVLVANASEFDRILVLPSSRGATGATLAVAGAAPLAQPGMVTAAVQPAVQPALQPDEEPDEPAAPQGATPAAGQPGAAQTVTVGPTGMIRAPETNFDYANPQLNPLLNPQLGGMPPGAPQNLPGMPGSPVIPPLGGFGSIGPMPGQPATAPGQPGAAPSPQGGTGRPGVIAPVPQAPAFTNPYGLPTNVRPGSVVAPPQEPDRSKYANPPQVYPNPPPPPPPQ